MEMGLMIKKKKGFFIVPCMPMQHEIRKVI
jgi:hypothetical protein